LLPENTAFHPPFLTEPSLYAQLTDQPLTGVLVLFVILIAAVKPLSHWPLTTYSQRAAWLAEDCNANPPKASSATLLRNTFIDDFIYCLVIVFQVRLFFYIKIIKFCESTELFE